MSFEEKTALPSPAELELCNYIREKTKTKWSKLLYQDPDIIGDLRITRFIRSKKGSKSKSLSLFENFIECRLENDHYIERTREEVINLSVDEMHQYIHTYKHPGLPFGFYIGDTDKGMPVMYIDPGKVSCNIREDIDKIKKENRPDRKTGMKAMCKNMTKFNIAVFEWHFKLLNNNSLRYNRMCSFVTVIQMGNIPSLKFMFDSDILTLKKNFPKRYNECYENHDLALCFTNVPVFFRALFTVISLLMSQNQRSKVEILGDASDSSVRERLHSWVNTELLPTELGGTGPGEHFLKCFPKEKPSTELYMNTQMDYYMKQVKPDGTVGSRLISPKSFDDTISHENPEISDMIQNMKIAEGIDVTNQ